MTPRSIAFRLVASSALWVIFTLVITEVVLAGLFRNHVERSFDNTLNVHMEELLAFSAVDEAGRVIMKRHPSDPQFVRPLSGWYWELRTGEGDVERSRSLWDQRLDVPIAELGEKPNAFSTIGPHGKPIRVMTRTFTVPDGDKPFTIIVAGPAEAIETAVQEFVSTLVFALMMLGVGLITAVIVQVRYGLWPLKHMRDTLADIRAGRTVRLTGEFASEIKPLADELNALLSHNAEVITRARSQAGDLAHALKTPLAVLTNEADRLSGESRDTIIEQSALMAGQIDRHLSRARVAGAHGVLGARTDVHAAVEGLCRTLRRIYEERQIEISMNGTEGVAFRGDRQDLEEMLGNLIDNACKWARRQVQVHAEVDKASNTFILEVIDDGPGIPDVSMKEVLRRGQRLDESIPGSGLGLSIACDIAELYKGSLTLGASSSGGLSARLSLPSG